jgi:hypothetical protein
MFVMHLGSSRRIQLILCARKKEHTQQQRQEKRKLWRRRYSQEISQAQLLVLGFGRRVIRSLLIFPGMPVYARAVQRPARLPHIAALRGIR